MSAEHELTAVTSADELRALVGAPAPRAATKVRTTLGRVDRQWLACAPLCLVATSSADGRCDVSPKGDPPGSVLVLDDTTVVLAERPGNRRVDGFLNVLENPHVGLIFVVPGRGDTLRVNGRAALARDAPFFDDLVVEQHRPALALVVDVEEVFYHCSKAFLRSRLWQPQSWDPDALPRRAQIALEVERAEASLEELDAYYGPGYAERLYR